MSCAVWFEAEEMITTYPKGMFSGKALASSQSLQPSAWTVFTHKLPTLSTLFFHELTVSESESKYFFLPV